MNMAKKKRRKSSSRGGGGNFVASARSFLNLVIDSQLGSGAGGLIVSKFAPQYIRWGQVGGAYLKRGFNGVIVDVVVNGMPAMPQLGGVQQSNGGGQVI
jgi:hypothetical protein